MTHEPARGVVTLLGVDLNPQDLFDGAVTGLVYGFLAIGVILLYRASGVVNFAYGAIGILAAVLVAKMFIDWNWPYCPRFLVGVAASAAVAGAIEMTVVRRLFDSARITLFVATIGAAQLVTVLSINVPLVEGVGTAFPTPFRGTWQLGDDITVHAPQVMALVAIPLVAFALGWFLNRTIWGIAITATAANPDASRLAGLSPAAGVDARVGAGRCARRRHHRAGRAVALHPGEQPRRGQRHPAPRHRAGGGAPGPDAVAGAGGRRGRRRGHARAGGLLQLGQPVGPDRVRAVRHRARRRLFAHRGRPAATAGPGPCRAGWRPCPTGCGRTCWCGGCPGCRPCSPSSWPSSSR